MDASLATNVMVLFAGPVYNIHTDRILDILSTPPFGGSAELSRQEPPYGSLYRSKFKIQYCFNLFLYFQYKCRIRC